MKELYAARLAEEARLVDVLVEEAESGLPASAGKTPEKAPEKSSAETMAPPRQQVDTRVQPEPRESTDRLERVHQRTPGRSSRAEPRGSSERRALEPRRTVDLRRAPAPKLAEEPRSASSERAGRRRTPAPEPKEWESPRPLLRTRCRCRCRCRGRAGRVSRPCLLPPRLLPWSFPGSRTVSPWWRWAVGLVMGLGLGGWWALRSMPAPVAAGPVTKPAPPSPRGPSSSNPRPPGRSPSPPWPRPSRSCLEGSAEAGARRRDGEDREPRRRSRARPWSVSW